jgi:hypothetical protein
MFHQGLFYSFQMLRSQLYLVFLICISFSILADGQGKFVMSDPIKEAYKSITSLKIEDGRSKLNLIRLHDPNNAMIWYIENYADFFTLFIQEDEELYKVLIKNKDERLKKIKSSDPSSPYYLFCQAEIILQWATIKLKFDDKISAARDVYEAYKMLEKNQKLFPAFTENNKSLSIIHALAESVPSWIRKIMGIKGSVDEGTQEISQLAKTAATQNSIFKDEIIAIYSYILFYSNNKKEEAYQLFQKYGLDHRKSPLIAFLKSTMAQKTGRNDEAIRILDERPTGKEYLPFYYLSFMSGKYKLSRLDKNAKEQILYFLRNFKGRHYIKEAWQKLAWYEIIVRNDKNGYRKYMTYCMKEGDALIDEDIQAYKEAKMQLIPDEILLKARVLYDGGYYIKSQSLLILQSDRFVNAIHDGEFYYRLARVTEALKNYPDALEYYDLTIINSDPGKYYACSAALNAGLIYEQQKKYGTARQYFEKCLDLDPAGYSSSLHQKAKSALDRIK